MNFARWVIGIASGLLLLLIGIGLLLPGTWTASADARIDAPPEAIWARVADLRAWDDWAPLGQVESEFSARTMGEGARRSWESDEWGTGEVRIEEAEEFARLVYRVDVDEGAVLTRGTVTLEPDGDGATRVVWTEEGDFGWNPFLAYIAPGMGRTQGAVLQQSLDALGEVMTGAGPGPSLPDTADPAGPGVNAPGSGGV